MEEGGDAKNTRETHAERLKAQTSYACGNACAYGNRNPLTPRPQSKRTNMQEQQTWLPTTAMHKKSLQKRWEHSGKLWERQERYAATKSRQERCTVHNAEDTQTECGMLQTNANRHSYACSLLLTKLNTFITSLKYTVQ